MKVLGIEIGPEGVRIKEREISDEEARAMPGIESLVSTLTQSNGVLCLQALRAVGIQLQEAYDILDTIYQMSATDERPRVDPERVARAAYEVLGALRQVTLAAFPEDAEENDGQRAALNSLARIRRDFERREWIEQKWDPAEDEEPAPSEARVTRARDLP